MSVSCYFTYKLSDIEETRHFEDSVCKLEFILRNKRLFMLVTVCYKHNFVRIKLGIHLKFHMQNND